MIAKQRAHSSRSLPRRQSNHRKPTGSLIAEFGPVLFILFVLTLVPLINLIGLATGAVTALLETNEAVSSAAIQEGYANSLSAMYTTCEKFFTMGFAKFTGLTPQNGYAACGMNLFIQTTPLSGKAVRQSAPNTPLSPPIDLTDNVYEFVGVNHVSIKPLISMENIPILGNVPGLGKPALLELTATRMVEHPTGLAYNTSSSGEPAPKPFAHVLTSSLPDNASGYNYNWRTPDIFARIQNAGETVVSVAVVVVPANAGITSGVVTSSNWTQTGLNVANGQKIWVDTTSNGQWDTWPLQAPNVDANGYSSGGTPANIAPNVTTGALVGHLGPTGQPFFLGDLQYNLALGNPGPLLLICNDAPPFYGDNIGSQIVRIVVVQ